MEVNQSVFDSFPLIETKRLLLRCIQPEDAEEIYRIRASNMVNRFIPRDNMAETEDAQRLVEKVTKAYKEKQIIAWAGIHRESGNLVGTCGFNRIEYENLRAEIGGEMATNYWGKHFAMEAVSAIVKFGFEVMNLHSIEAKVSPDNRGAIYLLEQIGFVKEAHFKDRGYFKGEFMDLAVYSLVKGYGISIH